MKPLILPSLLAADLGRLAAEIRRAADSGADALHIDIMDGAFVPNLSFGPAVVSLAKKHCAIPLSVHLMLARPDAMLGAFADAGADAIQIHAEAACDIAAALCAIRARGVKPGLVLNPLTPHAAALPYLGLADEVLQMTVFPGRGGQKFMPEPLPEITKLRAAANAAGRPDLSIMVDGGISRSFIAECARAGADAFVAGTALFSAEDMRAEVGALRALADAAGRG